MFASLLGLLPMPRYIVLEIDHFAIDLRTRVCVVLQGSKKLVERLELGLYFPDFCGEC